MAAISSRAWKIFCRRTPARTSWTWPVAGWKLCRASIHPGLPRGISTSACCCSLIPDMPYYEELKTLITSHLEDLRYNRLPQLAKRTGYTIERIQKAWEQLRKLNPKPGAQFADDLRAAP